MVTALAIAGSHAGWLVLALVLADAPRLGRFTASAESLSTDKGDTSARIHLRALIDPGLFGAFVGRTVIVVAIPNPICLLVRSRDTERAALQAQERGV
jgi:hypothetical protein